jgi:hypothetical protein
MLLDQEQPNSAGKVAIMTRSPEFTLLLSAILKGWRHQISDDPAMAQLFFVERGFNRGRIKVGGEIVWLTSLPLENEPHLEVPIRLAALHKIIEGRFFPTTRRHMRVPMRHPAELAVAGQRIVAELISLSERGARLSCPREFSPGQRLEVDVVLGERRLCLPGEALYAFPGGDVPGHRLPQVGVLFKPVDAQTCAGLARFVEQACVKLACSVSGIPSNAACLSWLDVPHQPWVVLSENS